MSEPKRVAGIERVIVEGDWVNAEASVFSEKSGLVGKIELACDDGVAWEATIRAQPGVTRAALWDSLKNMLQRRIIELAEARIEWNKRTAHAWELSRAAGVAVPGSASSDESGGDL